MFKVAAYVRVSEQEKSAGYTIEEQVKQINEFCISNGYSLAEVYADDGYEGETLDRPNLVRLIEDADKGLFNAVMVVRIDRLSLSHQGNLCVIREDFLKNNLEFISINDRINTCTESGREILSALDTFISLEKRKQRNSIMSGRTNRAKEGKWHGGGTEPIGYDYIDGKLVVNTAEAAQVRYVYYLYSQGYTMTEISRRMSDFCTKHGGWDHTSTIANVLDNPLYAGTVHFNSVNAHGSHKPIIDPKTNRLVKRRREKALLFNHQQKDSKHLLTGILRCGNCGARYFPRKYPDGTYRYICYSRAKTNKKMIKDPSCKNVIIDKEVVEWEVINRILELRNNPSELNKIAKKRTARGSGSMGAESEGLNVINRQITTLNELRNLKLLSEATTTQAIEGLARKRQSLMLNNEELSERMNRSFVYDEFKLNLSEFSAAIESENIKYCRYILSLLVDSIDIHGEELVYQWTF